MMPGALNSQGDDGRDGAKSIIGGWLQWVNNTTKHVKTAISPLMAVVRHRRLP